jgi:putative oxidoreductase
MIHARRSLDAIEPYGGVLLRIVVGAMLIPHGIGRLFGIGGQGLAGNAAWLETNGLAAGEMLAALMGVMELLGGILIMLGLLTRPVALVIVALIALQVLLYWPNGYFWLTGGPSSNAGRWSIVWALAVLAVALQGSGERSLDGVLRRRRL